MFKKLGLILMCFLAITLCQAGVGFDNFKCLNCLGEVRVPTGYVMFNGGTGWEIYGTAGILFLILIPIFYKKLKSENRKYSEYLWMLSGIASFLFILSGSLYYLDEYWDLEAKKEIVGTYQINNENLTIYLENDEIYESKTKEKFILGPYRDYLNTSKYHILRKEDKFYLVNFDKKTVYLLKKI